MILPNFVSSNMAGKSSIYTLSRKNNLHWVRRFPSSPRLMTLWVASHRPSRIVHCLRFHKASLWGQFCWAKVEPIPTVFFSYYRELMIDHLQFGWSNSQTSTSSLSFWSMSIDPFFHHFPKHVRAMLTANLRYPAKKNSRLNNLIHTHWRKNDDLLIQKWHTFKKQGFFTSTVFLVHG